MSNVEHQFLISEVKDTPSPKIEIHHSLIYIRNSIHHSVIYFLKRNIRTRRNGRPAFRSNAILQTLQCLNTNGITTTIGAKLLSSRLRINNFSSINLKSFIQVFIGIFSACLLFACENDMNEVDRLTRSNHPQFDYANEVEILYSEDGIVKAKINAPELVKNSTGKPFTEFAKGIRVEILNTAKKPVTVMTANYGKRYDKSEETIVQNDVVVTNQNGDKLETEELTRNDKTGELKTDAFVKITTATEVIYGMGLKANEDFSWYRIDSVQGIFNVNENNFFPKSID